MGMPKLCIRCDGADERILDFEDNILINLIPEIKHITRNNTYKTFDVNVHFSRQNVGPINFEKTQLLVSTHIAADKRFWTVIIIGKEGISRIEESDQFVCTVEIISTTQTYLPFSYLTFNN